jgi:hypothetical protein
VKWDDLQRWARKQGLLVYAMDQGQTPVLLDVDPGPADEPAPGPWGIVTNGFCVGLTMRWIGLRYRGQDYPFDAKTLVADGEFWEATRDQNIARGSTGPWPARLQTVVGQYGVPVDTVLSVKKNEPISARLVMQTIAGRNGFYYFELRGESGAHAFGIEWRPGGVHFFDSNEGHFLVPRKSFGYFFTRFLNHAPGNYKHYKAGTWIGVVR